MSLLNLPPCHGQKIPLPLRVLSHYKGPLPTYGTNLSSGFDLRAQITSEIKLSPGERKLIPTGLVFAIPSGFELQIRPRSGWALRTGLTLLNTPGTIDADYRGEVKVLVVLLGQEALSIAPQDRIAQAVLCPLYQAKFQLEGEGLQYPAESARPAGSAKPAGPTKPAGSAEPSGSAGPVKPAGPAEPSGSAKPAGKDTDNTCKEDTDGKDKEQQEAPPLWRPTERGEGGFGSTGCT